MEIQRKEMRKGKSFLRDFHQMRILFLFLNARMRTFFTLNRKNVSGQKFSTDYRIGYEKRIGFTLFAHIFCSFFFVFVHVSGLRAGNVFFEILFSKLKYCCEYFPQRSNSTGFDISIASSFP